MENKKKPGGGSKIVIPILVLVILVAGGACAYMSGIFGGSKGGEVTTISESTLQEVIEISELSTVQYTYNAVAVAYEDQETQNTIKYHVAYEATVKAGIDFNAIDINVDEENKTITIKIPQVKIQDYIVDEGTLDYIFNDEKYNTATVSAEAYKLCLNDLKERVKKETDLLNLARENAISTVKGLIEPWVEQIDSEYTVEVN